MQEKLQLVVLVDENDNVLGTMEKLKAHQEALLHRAFSVFLFNDRGEMLLQKRAAKKYHSPGKWTNAVCSHPYFGESYQQGAERRLREELGIEAQIDFSFSFIYKADVGDGLFEHELDHVFTGKYNGEFHLNPDEVSEVRYESLESIQKDIQQHPENYTEWFKIILQEYIQHL